MEGVLLSVRLRTRLRRLQLRPLYHIEELLSTDHRRLLAFSSLASQKNTKQMDAPLFFYSFAPRFYLSVRNMGVISVTRRIGYNLREGLHII